MFKFLVNLSLIFCLSITSGGVCAEVVDSPDWAYKIEKGDTFYNISRRYLTGHEVIGKLSLHNHQKLNQKLIPGRTLNIPIAMLKKSPVPVQVLVASGDVQAKFSDSRDFAILKKGDILSQGNVLKTGKYSVAKLGFADGSTIDVQQNTSIEISDSYQYAGKATYVILIRLLNGRTEVLANPKHISGNVMQIQTPSAIAAVRGTEFRVSADEGLSVQETLSGRVGFSASGQEVLLSEGYGSTVKPNEPPLPPIALPGKPSLTHLSELIENADNTVSFSLISQPEAIAWEAKLASDVDFNHIVSEQVISTTALAFNDLQDGEYHLRVRAKNKHSLSGEDAYHRFAVKRKVVVDLLLLSPIKAEKIGLAPTFFSWTKLPNCKQYQLQVARDQTFNDIVFQQTVAQNQVTINQSFGQGDFYWRVIAEGEQSVISGINEFSR